MQDKRRGSHKCQVKDMVAGKGREASAVHFPDTVPHKHSCWAPLCRQVSCDRVTAPAQQEPAVSQHLVPIKLLIRSGSATALGWFHPANGSVCSGQLELPPLLGPSTGHPPQRNSCCLRGLLRQRWFLWSHSTPQGPQRLPSKSKSLLALLSPKKIQKLNFQKFALAKT